MCTVTYIPILGGAILSSNRDESPDRSPKNLTRVIGSKYQLSYPQDILAGGTWIAADNRQRAICILNGAFIKHRHSPPYKMSRGILALEYFNCDDIDEFIEIDYNGIEPFTMIIIEHNKLYEFRWDELAVKLKKLDPSRTYIWSSCTLYSKEIQEQRELLFEEWKRTSKENNIEEINRFHNFSDNNDLENTIVMNRNDIVKTVSITNIEMTNHKTKIYYNELLKNQKDEQTIFNQIESTASE